MAALVVQAREKHGDALRVESTYGLEDVPVPEGVRVHREFDLVPRAKGKGGFPVLRLRTLEVAYMAEARQGATPSREETAKPVGPKSMADRRADLEKRRRIRAIELLRGSLLGIPVEVGTEKHPEKVTPPEAQVPALIDLVGLVLVYGTGHPVGEEPWSADRLSAGTLTAAVEAARKASSRDEVATRTALWNRVREPIARALRIVGTLKPEYVADLAAQAETVCGLCGLDWQKGFLGPATESLPEPRSWRAA